MKANLKNRKINWSSLPAPVDYYRWYFPALIIKRHSEWINVNCCFHEDKHPSLGINIKSGGYHCFGCGAKGGDIIAFHMQRFHLSFTATLTYFGAWEHE